MIDKTIYGDYLVRNPGQEYSELIWIPEEILVVLSSILYHARYNPKNVSDLDPISFWKQARKKVYIKWVFGTGRRALSKEDEDQD